MNSAYKYATNIAVKLILNLTMKNLKKLSRENLKFVTGGITKECAEGQAASVKCYISQNECVDDPDSGGLCIRYCNRYCY